MRRVQAEGADGTRREDRTLVFACHFKDVPKPVNTDFPGQLRFFFCHDGQQCCKVVDGVNLVFSYNFGNHLRIRNIGLCRRPAFFQLSSGFCTLDVAGDDSVVSITPSKFSGKLRAYLPCRANDQDIFHKY